MLKWVFGGGIYMTREALASCSRCFQRSVKALGCQLMSCTTDTDALIASCCRILNWHQLELLQLLI